MSKHIPTLYALTPITDTEGLENGKWYIVKTTDGDAHEMLFDEKEWHGDHEPYEYLRPLPEGTVAVSEKFIDAVKEAIEFLDDELYLNGRAVKGQSIESNSFYHRKIKAALTKLAQMGE